MFIKKAELLLGNVSDQSCPELISGCYDFKWILKHIFLKWYLYSSWSVERQFYLHAANVDSYCYFNSVMPSNHMSRGRQFVSVSLPNALKKATPAHCQKSTFQVVCLIFSIEIVTAPLHSSHSSGCLLAFLMHLFRLWAPFGQWTIYLVDFIWKLLCVLFLLKSCM